MKDKINGLNTLLKAADGSRHCSSIPLQDVDSQPSGSAIQGRNTVPDQASEFSHLCDAVGYLVLGEMDPLRRYKTGRGPTFY